MVIPFLISIDQKIIFSKLAVVAMWGREVGSYVLTPGYIEMPRGDWRIHASCKLQGMKWRNYPRMVSILFWHPSNQGILITVWFLEGVVL